MNGVVHYTFTKRWAEQACFSADDAEAIARADLDVDRLYPGRRMRYKGWHLRWAGVRKRARALMAEAVERRDLAALGQALHCEQDAISHGLVGSVLHYPGIDLWERRSDRTRSRIEHATKRLLREYAAAADAPTVGDTRPS